MKSNNAYVSAAVAVAMAANFLLPVAAGAQTANVNAVRPKAGMTNFCTAVTTESGKMPGRMTEMRGNLDAARTMRDKRMVERDAKQDARIAELRTKEDGKRAEIVGKLQTKATTDAQKTAITAFQAAVNKAVDARRAAVNAANDAFDKGVKDALAQRKTKVDAAVKAFTDAVNAATAKAKTDCAATNADAAKIRETMQASIRAAEDKLAADRQAIDEMLGKDARRDAAEGAREGVYRFQGGDGEGPY